MTVRSKGHFKQVCLALGLMLAVQAPVSADGYPPYWDNSNGAVHFAPAPWPAEPDDPANCGLSCDGWKPYTRFQNSVVDPRTQELSNGGTRPQNYVNIASSCIDQTYPSIYYSLYQASDPADDVIMFR